MKRIITHYYVEKLPFRSLKWYCLCSNLPVCRCGNISIIFTWSGGSTFLSSVSFFAELLKSSPMLCFKLSMRAFVKVPIFSFNTASTIFSLSGFSCTVRVVEALLDFPCSSQTWKERMERCEMCLYLESYLNHQLKIRIVYGKFIPRAEIGRLRVLDQQVARMDLTQSRQQFFQLLRSLEA